MDISNTENPENPERKASEFELGSGTQMLKSKQVSIFVGYSVRIILIFH